MKAGSCLESISEFIRVHRWLKSQVVDGHVAVDDHLAGEALIGWCVQALQEVALLRAGVAAVVQPLRDAYAASAAGARATAEGDVGAGGVRDALKGGPGGGFHQQVLEEEVDFHVHATSRFGSSGATSSTWPKGALSWRPRMRGRIVSMISWAMARPSLIWSSALDHFAMRARRAGGMKTPGTSLAMNSALRRLLRGQMPAMMGRPPLPSRDSVKSRKRNRLSASTTGWVMAHWAPASTL